MIANRAKILTTQNSIYFSIKCATELRKISNRTSSMLFFDHIIAKWHLIRCVLITSDWSLIHSNYQSDLLSSAMEKKVVGFLWVSLASGTVSSAPSPSENQLETCSYRVTLYLCGTKTFGKQNEHTKTLL